MLQALGGWTIYQWVGYSGAVIVALFGLYLLVDRLSAAASRAWHAEKEKHIKRVMKIAKEDDKT